MSDVAATNCGGGCSCGGGSNNSCLIIILLLLCCGGCGGFNGGCGDGCGGCGNDCGGSSALWIIILHFYGHGNDNCLPTLKNVRQLYLTA